MTEIEARLQLKPEAGASAPDNAGPTYHGVNPKLWPQREFLSHPQLQDFSLPPEHGLIREFLMSTQWEMSNMQRVNNRLGDAWLIFLTPLNLEIEAGRRRKRWRTSLK